MRDIYYVESRPGMDVQFTPRRRGACSKKMKKTSKKHTFLL
jgi:hypothetical protein